MHTKYKQHKDHHQQAGVCCCFGRVHCGSLCTHIGSPFHARALVMIMQSQCTGVDIGIEPVRLRQATNDGSSWIQRSHTGIISGSDFFFSRLSNNTVVFELSLSSSSPCRPESANGGTVVVVVVNTFCRFLFSLRCFLNCSLLCCFHIWIILVRDTYTAVFFCGSKMIK